MIQWQKTEHGGLIAEHDAGDETGAIVTTATVHQGGNGRWTPCVYQRAKGRPKKKSPGRVAGKSVGHHYPGQFDTRAQAIEWCETKWKELLG